jgi:tetratricopeptide (TPR) repeat protein
VSHDALIAKALAHHRAGRLADAEAAYRDVLAATPDNTGVLHNLAVLAAQSDRRPEAIELFHRAIDGDPGYVSAHINLAHALRQEGRDGEAIESWRRVVALEPDHYEAHRALGFLWLGQGRRDRALDHFARTLDLRRGEDRTGIAGDSLTHGTRAKLLHDAEQLRYRAAHGPDRARQGMELRARAYEAVAVGIDASVGDHVALPLTDDQLDRLGEDYNASAQPTGAPELTGPAINPRLDIPGITNAYRQPPGAAWFDDLLTDHALTALRKYLLTSAIWFDFTHIPGFLASYLEDGLACPLMLQIIDELRAAFPDVLGDHALSQAWAFKGIAGDLPIDLHADDAVVSVNFWITPDTANLDPDHGGLLVCKTPPPTNWRMADYESDIAEIRAFFDQHADDRMVVPYRQNRALLFDSRLFHGSDAPSFRAGYAHHRINITLLFGERGAH